MHLISFSRRRSLNSKMMPMIDALESRLLWTVVSGTVYQDLNGNGKPDAGEGMPGCVVTFNENTTHHVGTPITAADGSYSVLLEPGTYHLTADGPGVEKVYENNAFVVGATDITKNLPVNAGSSTGGGSNNGGGSAKPDLSVTVSQVQGTMLVGSTKPQNVTVTVSNKGKGAYSGPVTATLYFSKNAKIEDSDLHFGPITLPKVKLAAGSNKTITFNAAPITAQLLPGKWNVLVGLTGLVNDANKGNDKGSAKGPVTVAKASGSTNIQVAVPGKMKVSPTKMLKFTFDMKNVGDSAAVGKGNLTLSARPVGGGADVALSPWNGLTFDLGAKKGFATGSITEDVSALPAGTYKLVAKFTPTQLSPAESNKKDNKAVSEQTFTIK